MEKYITVAIPNYNHGYRLKKVLDSVINQTLNNKYYEILVIDDGSTDNSVEILKKIDGIRLLTQTNKGLSQTRSELIKNVSKKTTHLYFLDSDDIMESNLLKEHFENNINEDKYVSADSQVWELSKKEKSTSKTAKKHPQISLVYSTVTSKLWRISDLKDINWPDRLKNEDDFAIPLALNNREMVFVKSRVLVLDEPGSLSKQKDVNNAIKLIDLALKDWKMNRNNSSFLKHSIVSEGAYWYYKKAFKNSGLKVPGFFVQIKYIGFKRAFADFWVKFYKKK